MKQTNKEWALKYAERGWLVFPVHTIIDEHCSCGNKNCSNAGKHPIPAHGFKEATLDNDIIKVWWARDQKANIGIPTGRTNGIVVIDVDPRNGGHESLVELHKAVPELKNTLTHKTGGGGFHFFYEYPSGINELKSGKCASYTGIDVKADRGYVIGPPSMHASGTPYSIVDNGFSTPQPLPPKLLEILLQQNSRNADRAKPLPEIIPEGERNVTLASLAGSLHHRGASHATIVAALKTENDLRCRPPLPEKEIHSIALSISRYPVSKHAPHVPIAVEEWPEPEPLKQNLSPVPTIDLDYLPELLREWVKDISSRMQCPIEYPIASAFALLSGAVGKKICIQPKQNDHGFIVVPNLWGGIIGNPGQKKSPAMEEALSPLRALHDIYSQLYKIQMAEYEEAIGTPSKDGKSLRFLLSNASSYVLKLYEGKGTVSSICEEFRRRRAISKQATDPSDNDVSNGESHYTEGGAPQKPVRRQLITNDVTMEKLGEILSVNPYGASVIRDELAGLFAQLHAPNNRRDRPFLMEGWSGTSSYTFDRIGRGTIHIPHLVVSIFGSSQPDVIAHFISETAEQIGNDGFLQRFQMLVYPDEIIARGYTDLSPNKDVVESVTEAVFKLAMRNPEDMGAKCREQAYSMGTKTIAYLQFDDKGQELYQKWYEHINDRIYKMEGQSLLAQHLNKYHKLMPAIALLCHLAESVDKNRYGPVTSKSVKMAEYWCDVLENHAIRIYGLKAQGSGTFQAGMLLEKIKEGKLHNHFTVRDVIKRDWTALNSRDVVAQACRILEQHFYIRPQQVPRNPTGGRPTVRYEINPAMLGAESTGEVSSVSGVLKA